MGWVGLGQRKWVRVDPISERTVSDKKWKTFTETGGGGSARITESKRNNY